MARNPDDYFADLTSSGGAAVEPKPRYAPAPKTPDEADARLSEVDAAEEEIRAWAESKRAKRGRASAPEAAAPKPAEKKDRSADEYFADLMPPPAPPKAPKKPGLIDRATTWLGEGRSKPDPSLSGITPEQARGMTGDAPQGLAAVAPRAGLLSAPATDQSADPMLRPAYVEQVRNRFANVPAHMRLPALREYAKTNDATGRAARQILREVEGENSRITPDDERLAKRIGPLTQGPERGGQEKPPPLPFPDPTPTFGDTMDGTGSEEVAQRRLTAQKVAEAGKPTMRDAKGAVAQKRAEKASPVEDTWLETPWNLYAAGAAGIGRMVAAGAGLVDAMSSEGSMRQELAASLQDWASGTADELGAQQSRKLKKEGIEFARLIDDESASVADMAGYLVTRPELFASKFAESVIPMLISGAVGRVAGAGAAARSQIALGGAASVTPAAAARIGQIAGNAGVAGAVVTEAAQIAGGVFNKAIEDGMPRDAAQRSAGNAFLGALLIGKVTGGGAAGAVAAKRAGAVREGAKEFGEEYAQTWLETLAPALGGGQDIDVAKANKEAVAGGIIGAGVGGATGGMNSLQAFLTPKPTPEQPALPPSQARSASIDRFGELAAGFGLPEKALSKAREAAANMPAGDVPAFLAKLADAYNRRGMFAKPLEPGAITELQTAIDGPPADAEKNAAVDSIEATLKAAGALPDEALNVTGLADEGPTMADATPEAPVDAVWLSAESDVPVQVVGPAQAGPDGREYTPVVGPDGAQSFLPADELIEADRKAPDGQPQPELPSAAASVPGAGAAGDRAAAAGGGVVRPVADDANGAATASPVQAAAGGGSGVPAGRDGEPDAALNAAAPVSTQTPAKAGATEAAAPAVRQLGKYGRTPGDATAIELRPNADGTLTPYTGKYPLVDHESGEPVVIPAGATDAEAVDAIRSSGAVTKKDKFFGLKGDAKPENKAEAAPAEADPAQADAEAPALTREDQVAAARRRIDGLKLLLKCLTS